jgi:hypothetical protein
VKIVGVFPDNSHDPIIYPMAATVNAKPGTIEYLAFLRSAAAKSIFQGYGFSVLAKPTPTKGRAIRCTVLGSTPKRLANGRSARAVRRVRRQAG